MKVKLHKGGVERVMLFGVPKVLAAIEIMAAMLFVLALRSLLVIPFIIALHIVLVILYKRDQHFVEILISHLQEDDYLEP